MKPEADHRPTDALLPTMRADYSRQKLRNGDLLSDPIAQFEAWLGDAVREEVIEPNAMSLATVDADGQPLLRSVLPKGLDARGFVFYTNLESRKARHIAGNPRVSLLFPWLKLERQVIVTGEAVKLSAAESLKYFLSRPRDSQIAVWASRQSRRISTRKALEMEWARLKAKFDAGEVPLPSFWGGFRVVPATIEFWQGGPNRLHDRFQYSRQSDEPWALHRLAP